MTVEQQIKQFEMMLQTTSEKFNDSEKPDSDTILLYLNIAQVRYMKEKYFSSTTVKDNTFLLGKRTEELRNLIINTEISTLVDYYANYGKLLTLPTNYLFYLKSDSKITRITLKPVDTAVYVPNTEIEYQDIDKLMTTPFNIPVILKPGVFFREYDGNAGMLVMIDKYTTLSKVMITYVRIPKILVLDVVDSTTETVTCELASYMHDDITAVAVRLYEEYKYRLMSKDNQQQSKPEVQ